jgi:hypothetical protein
MDRKTVLQSLSGAPIARPESGEIAVEHIFPSTSGAPWWDRSATGGPLLGNFSLVTARQRTDNQDK